MFKRVGTSGQNETKYNQEYIVNNFQNMSWNISPLFSLVLYSITMNNIYDYKLLPIPFLLNKVAELYETYVKYFQHQRLNKKHFLKSLELNPKLNLQFHSPDIPINKVITIKT